MKNFLITGGAGYIGSMLSTVLVNKGKNVTVVDDLRYSSSSLNHLKFFSNFKFIKNDVRDKKLLKKIIPNYDFIIPLAALVGAPLCENNKKEAVETNYESIKFILNNLKKRQKIIYMNSNSGYGIGEKNKFCTEESPLKPISLYGRTKIEAEQEVLKFENSVCFRLATVFGYSYRMRTDLLVNYMVYESVKNGLLKIFEPHFRRNFIHVRDVVNGIIFAIEKFSYLKSNTYNLGLSDANITKYQLAKKIKKYKKEIVIQIVKGIKDPDQRDYFVSNSKIERKGFKAKINLDMGIKEMISVFENDKLNSINNY